VTILSLSERFVITRSASLTKASASRLYITHLYQSAIALVSSDLPILSPERYTHRIELAKLARLSAFPV